MKYKELQLLYENMWVDNNDVSNMKSSYTEGIRLLKKKFPWAKKIEENADLMCNFNYYPEDDTLTFSVAYMEDHVSKKEAIETAKQVFPKLKQGMDYHSYSKDKTRNTLIIPNKDPENYPPQSMQVGNVMYILGEKIKSYDVSIDNVQTGFWDLVLTVYNASNEPPNKLIKACEVFYNAVEYLVDGFDEFDELDENVIKEGRGHGDL